MQKKLPQLLLFILLTTLFLFPSITSAAITATDLKMYSKCDEDENCLTTDCEKSTLVDKTSKNRIWFCDCRNGDANNDGNNDACMQFVGGPPNDGGTWSCRDGANTTYDIDYCESLLPNGSNGTDKRGMPPFLGELGVIDAIFDQQALQAKIYSDVQNLKPELSVKIPGLNFSDLKNNIDAEGYMYIPYIGEFIAAIYKYGIVVLSIVAAVMVIVQGVRIVTSGGGAEKAASFKKIGQIVIGLLIAWLSYAILYTLNPDLVSFKSLKIKFIEAIPLDVYDKGETPTPLHPKALNFTGFDTLFQLYGNCVPVDWKIIKAMAYVESSLDANVVNSLGFAGLFQTKDEFCRSSIKRYKMDSKCNELTNPELSTAVGTSMIRDSVAQIKKNCPNIDGDSLAYFIYLGHQSGQGTLSNVITKTCKYETAYSFIHASWEKQSGGKYADSTGKKRTATHIATEADKGARKMIGLIKGMGVTSALISMSTTKCPLDTPNLRFTTTVGAQ